MAGVRIQTNAGAVLTETENDMKKLMIVALAGSAFLCACGVVPVPVVYDIPAPKCPPGQAKKGLCGPAYETPERSFCPPRQAKKGNC